MGGCDRPAHGLRDAGVHGGDAGQERVGTGVDGLDRVLDGLRIGDNVVWQVDDLADYRRMVRAFVAAARASGRTIIYLRYGQHPPLLEPAEGIRVVTIDADRGFEAFTRVAYQAITDYGTGAFYVCDCLSDLLDAWATDDMVGRFFQVVCPYLYELDTVAYFALHPQQHSHVTLSRIRETTQVMVDIRRAGDDVQLQPVKVWQRHSPTMFLPHRQYGDRFEPVTDSLDAIRLQAAQESRHRDDTRQRLLDYWDRMFWTAADSLSGYTTEARQSAVLEQIVASVVSRDRRMLALAQKYLTLEDMLGVRERMIGSGFIGGKAVGMLLARAILRRDDPECWQQSLEPHDSFFLGSDVYYAFLVHNGCWPQLMRQRKERGFFDEAPALRERILQGELPPEFRPELERMLDHFGQYPVLVRSSSLLEDGFGNAFAGQYESVFCINQGNPEQRLADLEAAIRQVYASTMSAEALGYRWQRQLSTREEPMALLFQRVNGSYRNGYYLPDAAGVGVSRNTFAWDPDMDQKAGMLRLVVGLGTRAVDRIDGDHACVAALDRPGKRPFRSRDDAYSFCQHSVDVLDIDARAQSTVPLRTLQDSLPEQALRRVAEPDHEASRRSRELGDSRPVWRPTFSPLLRDQAFIGMMQRMLHGLEAAYQHPVEVEFTLHFREQGTASFNLVQCRPLATLGGGPRVQVPSEDSLAPDDVLFATRGHFMGGNMDLALGPVIRVDAERYSRLSTGQKHAVARLVGRLNQYVARGGGEAAMLMGPGRWGSSSPELGVPVRFGEISAMAALTEVAEMGAGMVPDLSFGSHFFQNLVEARIAYVALFPGQAQTLYRPQWFQRAPRLELPATGDTEADDAVRAAVEWYDGAAVGLRLLADVAEQRLVCAAHATGEREA